MQPTNTTYNAFSGNTPATNDNAFQSAIDYLIANRQKPVFTNPGLFTQGTNTESKSSVMTDLFGDQYIKRNQNDGGSGGDGFVGNPNAGGVGGGGTGRGNFASAGSVLGSLNAANNLSGMGRALGQVGSGLFGPAGMLLGLVPRGVEAYANSSWDSFNRGIDSDAAARAEAASLGGLGTFSDSQGNIGTISNQGLVDAYDRATFGITSAEMDAARDNSGGGAGPVGADAPGMDYSGYSAADLGL